MQHLSWVELSQAALRHNVRVFKEAVGKADLFLVVKSNAYGHGSREVTRILNNDVRVAGFMVASLDEALELTKYTKKRIIILSMWQRDSALIAEAIARGIEFPVYDMASAKYLHTLGKHLKKKINVHIKVDVGTTRLGLRYDAFAEILNLWRFSSIKIVGIFAHFADSESINESFTKLQHDRFEKVVDSLSVAGHTIPMVHIACSAAALRSAKYHHNAVRLGIALYGLWPSEDSKKFSRRSIHLKPVLTWKTKILQVKNLSKGDSVGYGMSYRAAKPLRIATLPIGYWDGYDRKFSNTASVLIHGKRCPVRGRVCMNVTMVELPQGIKVLPNDEVVVLGRQGLASVSVEELADNAGTINYEIVTRINPTLPRIVI
jgi:alanine racemase